MICVGWQDDKPIYLTIFIDITNETELREIQKRLEKQAAELKDALCCSFRHMPYISEADPQCFLSAGYQKKTGHSSRVHGFLPSIIFSRVSFNYILSRDKVQFR